MVLIVTLIGGVGCVACATRPSVCEARRERLERLGGLFLVAGLIGLGYGLAQAGA